MAADRGRSTLSAFFGWAIGEGIAEVNPVIGTNKSSKGVQPRARPDRRRGGQDLERSASFRLRQNRAVAAADRPAPKRDSRFAVG